MIVTRMMFLWGLPTNFQWLNSGLYGQYTLITSWPPGGLWTDYPHIRLFIFIPSILWSDFIMQRKQTWQIAAQTGATFVFAPGEVRAGPPFLQTIQLWIFLRGNGEEWCYPVQ